MLTPAVYTISLTAHGRRQHRGCFFDKRHKEV